MAEKITRQINYYLIQIVEKEDHSVLFEELDITSIFNYAQNLPNKEKLKKAGKNKKIGIENFSTKDKKTYSGYFKTVKYGKRSNLVDTINNTERENPKTLNEGEKERTHFALRNSKGEISLVMDSYSGSVSEGQLRTYLKKMNELYHDHLDKKVECYINILPALDENFEDKLESLQRAAELKVTIDKNIISDSDLDFVSQEHIEPIKSEVSINIKAERNKDIRQAIRDANKNMNKKDSKIARIWVRGFDENNNEQRFWVDQIRKKIKNTVDTDINGVISSSEMITILLRMVS